MGNISRDIYTLSARRTPAIDIVYGSAVPIHFNMMDITIPDGAAVVFYAQQQDGPVYRADGWKADNTAGFTPPEGFFKLGYNLLQLEINGKIIPVAIDVKCHERLSGAGSEATPEQVRPLVEQALSAARDALESKNAAASSAGAAAGSAQEALERMNAAAGSASAASGSADAAAGSAQEALERMNAAAGSAGAAAGSAQEALESKNAAAGSASAAAGSAGAAAGSAQEALESKNAAAGSASAAAGSATNAAGSAQEAKEALEKNTSIAVSTPYIGENGNWFVWNTAQDSYVDSGIKAQGPQGIPGIGNVSSVCGVIPGDDGNVALAAENVGARPDTWMPTASDVGARPEDWVPTADDIGAVPVSGLLSKTYPIGAIYLSASSTSPAELFGGTWERLKDRFLLAAGDSYTAGSTGGEAKHTLTGDEMPSHLHTGSKNFLDGATMGGSQSNRGVFCVGGGWDISRYDMTGKTGGGQPHNNMPPYLAVYMWKRVA